MHCFGADHSRAVPASFSSCREQNFPLANGPQCLVNAQTGQVPPRVLQRSASGKTEFAIRSAEQLALGRMSQRFFFHFLSASIYSRIITSLSTYPQRQLPATSGHRHLVRIFRREEDGTQSST